MVGGSTGRRRKKPLYGGWGGIFNILAMSAKTSPTIHVSTPATNSNELTKQDVADFSSTMHEASLRACTEVSEKTQTKAASAGNENKNKHENNEPRVDNKPAHLTCE